MIEILPKPVFEAVASHLRTATRRTYRDWEANRAHEDSLTGAAFASFTTHRTRSLYLEGQRWRWRVRAWKFGSGGKGSEERKTGADGIVEVEVKHTVTGELHLKSLLVQAKKQWTGTDSTLRSQVERMEKLGSGSSAVIDYSEAGYCGVSSHEVLRANGSRKALASGTIVPLGDFLAESFLACRVGLRRLYFDPRRRLLHVPAREVDAIAFVIPERLRVEIEEGPA